MLGACWWLCAKFWSPACNFLAHGRPTSKVQFRTLFIMMGNPKKIQSLLTDRWSALLYVENFFTHFWFGFLKGPLRHYKARAAELRRVCIGYVFHWPKGHGSGSTPDAQSWDGATLQEDRQCWYACGSRRGNGRELKFCLHFAFSQTFFRYGPDMKCKVYQVLNIQPMNCMKVHYTISMNGDRVKMN